MRLARALAVGLFTMAACPAAPVARLDLQPWQSRPVEPAGAVWRQRVAIFDLGSVRYGIQYGSKVKEGEPGFIDVGEGPVGMPFPFSEGWYHGGFIQPLLNGQRLDAVPLSSLLQTDQGQRVSLDLVWHHPTADLRYRFIGLPGDDKLLLLVDLQPKVPVQSFELALTAYPSYFTSWNKRVGARRTLTPGGTIAEGQKRKLSPEEGWAGLMYDEVFDPAKGEGHGANGFVTLPEALASVTEEPASYPSFARLALKPETRQVRLAFWKFPGKANAEVLAAWPAASAAARRQLAELDPTPSALKAFQPAEMAATLEAARRSPTVAKALGAKLDQLAAWLTQVRPLFEQHSWDITATEAFLRGYEQQQNVMWDVRLTQLLDF